MGSCRGGTTRRQRAQRRCSPRSATSQSRRSSSSSKASSRSARCARAPPMHPPHPPLQRVTRARAIARPSPPRASSRFAVCACGGRARHRALIRRRAFARHGRTAAVLAARPLLHPCARVRVRRATRRRSQSSAHAIAPSCTSRSSSCSRARRGEGDRGRVAAPPRRHLDRPPLPDAARRSHLGALARTRPTPPGHEAPAACARRAGRARASSCPDRYALVLSGNHVFTSGAIGTHTAVIRGALRAENQRLLTVILPQTIDRQPEETRTLLALVEQVRGRQHGVACARLACACRSAVPSALPTRAARSPSLPRGVARVRLHGAR